MHKEPGTAARFERFRQELSTLALINTPKSSKMRSITRRRFRRNYSQKLKLSYRPS